jgi:hypothetical protein
MRPREHASQPALRRVSAAWEPAAQNHNTARHTQMETRPVGPDAKTLNTAQTTLGCMTAASITIKNAAGLLAASQRW